MGLLREDETLDWPEIVEIKNEIKRNGIEQFIKVYKEASSTFVHSFIWGDELEMMIACEKPKNENEQTLEKNHIKENKTSTKSNTTTVLCLNSDIIHSMKKVNVSVEFASYMVETTPTLVHQSSFNDLLKVESCMLTRYECIKRKLRKTEAFPLLITCFPKIGYYDSFNIPVSYSYSKFFPDEAITKHNRFHSFVKNIIERRGKRVEGYIKIMENDIDNQNKGSVDKNESISVSMSNDSKDNAKSPGHTEDNEKSKGCIFQPDICMDCTQESDICKCKTKSNDIHSITSSSTIGSTESKLKTNTFHALPEKEYIRIDSMGQGMGCCCLQLTLQACTIKEARIIYDNIGALCPLLLRLTRATPICQGRVLQTETRWDMLVYSVDCRNDKERGCSFYTSGDSKNNKNLDSSIVSNYPESERVRSNSTSVSSSHSSSQPKKEVLNGKTINKRKVPKGKKPRTSTETTTSHNSDKENEDPMDGKYNFKNTDTIIQKSRFSSIDMSLMEDAIQYNDLYPPLHKPSYDALIKAGVDDVMSQHISSLFIRDPILVYKSVEKHETDDFENIQSSNWRSMRFKLPAKTTFEESGWKVEVRPMEIQPTCFENTSWCIFVVLLSRAIISHGYDFHIPLSLVDENFRRANLCIRKMSDYKDKLGEDMMKFYYRVNINDNKEAIVKEGTIREIFMGTNEYEGIFNIVKRFMEENCVNEMTQSEVIRETNIFKGEDDEIEQTQATTTGEKSCKTSNVGEVCSNTSSNNICCIKNVFTDKVKARTLDDYLDFVRSRLENEMLSVSDFMRMFVVRNDGLEGSVVKESVLDDLMGVIRKSSDDNNTDYLINK